MNNETLRFLSELQEYLLSFHSLNAHYNGQRTFVRMRCPFCGDSKIDVNKTRLYVKVYLVDEDDSLYYHCHNCSAHGSIKELIDRLEEINPGSIDNNLYTDIVKMKRRNGKFTKLLNAKIIKYKIPNRKQITNNKSNRDKIEYLKNRLGINLTEDKLEKYKLIIDFRKFLEINNINLDNHTIDVISQNYIGFLSNDNGSITFRNIIPNIGKNYRYFIQTLKQGAKKLYTISTEIDIMKSVEIYMAEGVFDIIGVYENIVTNKNNDLFVAICGNSYGSVLKYLICKYGIIFFNVTIYSDQDVSIEKLRNDLSRLGNRIHGSVKVYYNELEKDYGVTKDKIKLKETYI